jgi:hypothetical protein
MKGDDEIVKIGTSSIFEDFLIFGFRDGSAW